MALDPLERERLRRKMALKMGSFLEGGERVVCVSGHFYEENYPCELCQDQHARELVVVKNRSNRKLHVAVDCLKEMVRFRVADVDDLPKWLEKIGQLKIDAEKRKAEQESIRQEERRRLEKKVIVRKRQGAEPV